MQALFESHPAAATVCLLTGILGLALVGAFLAPFEFEHFGPSDFKRTWEKLRGVRFIFPLGIVFCAVALGVYTVWLR